MINHEYKKIFIFGASLAGEKAYKILRSFDVDIECYLDNDKSKWNTKFNGKKVSSPNILKDISNKQVFVIIASMYRIEISSQLLSYKLIENIEFMTIEDFTFCLVNENIEMFKSKIASNIMKQDKEKMIFTLPKGMILGGVEVWSVNLFKKLNDSGEYAIILNLNPYEKENIFSIEHKNKIIDIFNSYEHISYIDTIINLCNILISMLPIKIFPNNSEEMFLSLHILKQIYKDKVKVISVMHGDNNFVMEQNYRYREIIYKFVCVSEEIKNKFINRLKDREDDIIVKISPINHVVSKREYSSYSKPLKVGFVGRLVKEAKRCDYLIKIIEYFGLLENINVEFHIAGYGDYYNQLYEMSENKKYKNIIHLHGIVPYDQMEEFWRSMDVYLNVSDYEGTSLAMLEALGCGVVPIVTNVSGVKLFVDHKVNGFICDRGDVDAIIKNILYISNYRELLKEYGEICIQKIEENCSTDKYIRTIINL